MLTFWGVVTAATVFGGIPTVGGLWMFERWRARRRNRRGGCAACGTSWRATASGDPYLIQGRLVCEDCAAEARRRLPWRFGVLGLAVAVGTGVALAAGGFVPMTLLPVGSTIVMTVGAVQLMKLANRRAQRRIAFGEFPALEALGPGVSEEGGEA